jgi:hypothetical protein
MVPLTIEWDALVDRFKTPEIGPKDGPYFCRCGFTDNRRHSESQQDGYLIILDADSSIDPDTGETVQGAPDPVLVHEILQQLDITHCIYSSWSNGQKNKGTRYRVLIPALLSCQEDLGAAVGWLVNLIQSEGTMLADVKENHAFPQAWYLPRVPDEAARAAYVLLEHDGLQDFPLDQARDWYRAQVEQQQKAEAEIQADLDAATYDPESPISKFNAMAGPEVLHKLLLKNGYTFHGASGTGDGKSYRYMRPGSTSETPGVKLFKDGRGTWRVMSWHGADDPLSARSQDAFGLLTVLECSGDEDKALEKAREMFPDEPHQGKEPLYLSLRTILKRKLEWIWVVDGLLLASRVYQLHGQWKAGKSLVALDLALHMAQGKPWLGKQLTRCLVIYVAGEAATDIQARIQAFNIEYGLDPAATFALRCLPVYLTDKVAAAKLREEVKDILASLPEPLPIVIFIDTLARNFGPGKSESNDADMGQFINHLIDEVSRPLSALSIVVHHPGHGAKDRGRGHSSLPGAVDGTLQVEQKGTSGVITLGTQEMRNIKGNADKLAWTIKGIDLPVTDNFDRQVNAPVLVPHVLPDHNQQAADEADHADRMTRDVVIEILKTSADRRAAEPGMPDHYPSKKKIEEKAGEAGCKARSIKRVVKAMSDAGEIIDAPLPDGISIRGRNSFAELVLVESVDAPATSDQTR